jgi:4-hydroxyproline epimerase
MAKSRQQRVEVIDSHTGGEPTRVVVQGGPDLGRGDLRQRRDVMRARFDWLRSAIVTEPRGAPWMVGALLQEPVSPDCDAGVIFFNNAGYLGMCGHGLIGLVETLRYLDRLNSTTLRIETPVGEVTAWLESDAAVSFENVPSYRLGKDVVVDVPGYGPMQGDVAWGGNWFYLARLNEDWMRSPLERLTDLAQSVKQALRQQGITGFDGAEIDHVELLGEPIDRTQADCRSFVLCPGGHYDRSPCGTGASAKLACLAADGVLQPGDVWRQESVIGSVFHATYRRGESAGAIIPRISGRAFINADVHLVMNPADPYRLGIPCAVGG